ncbi:TPA: VirB4 family type IV secretion/conjugal transfer ATPase [Klebsiella pneumoniae]|nr:VirB4 family type IV secretion/conjugal transfer ATPase [Klebsiella pneumoniae]
MAVAEMKRKGVKDFKKEPSSLKYIPYSYHITPHVISTVNGEYLTIFKIRGRTHDCASNADLVKWHTDLNQLLKGIGNEHVKLWTHTHHREINNYPDTHYNMIFPRMVNEYYRDGFDETPMMVNDLYLTVVYNPVGDVAQKMFAKFDKPSVAELRDMQADSISSLEDISEQVMNSLRPYGIERLGYYFRDKTGKIIQEKKQDIADADDDDVMELREDLLADVDYQDAQDVDTEAFNGTLHTYSRALEWLYFLVNGEWAPVPVCRGRIREYLATTRPTASFWGDGIEIRGTDERRYTSAVEIRDYDADTEPGQINILMEAPFEYVLTQTYCCMSQQSARTYLTNQQNALLETGDPSYTQINQMNEAVDGVVSRTFIMGWHHLTVHAFGSTLKQARTNAGIARNMLNNCGLIASAVGLASEAAYYAKLPANQHLSPRPCPLNSWNFLCFSPFHNFMSGKANNNPWGPALTLFKTVANTPLYMNFHVTPDDELSFGKRPLAHTLMLGRSGAGKTTLLNFLLTQAMKYNPRIFAFDRDQGMMPMIKALHGHYTVLKEGVPSGWAPLQMPGTKINIAFCKRLFRLCAEITKGSALSADQVNDLNGAVDAVMDETSLIPHEMRTVDILIGQLDNPYSTGGGDSDSNLTLAKLLEPWSRGHENGWLFDNDTDSLNLSEYDIYGFDLTDFIVADNEIPPATRTPLLMYLNFRVRQSIDGRRRVIQVFDEFHQYLDDPIMSVEVKRGLKTDRKKDAVYVFSTQEPNDALDSSIGKTIMQQCVTKILLENPDADYEDYVTRLKLTPAEFEALLSIPENSRQFLVKQGSQSAMAQFNLAPRVKTPENFRKLDKILSILSGETQNAETLAKIIERIGDDNPEKWLDSYWKTVLAA